ncbi:hypothetical protein V7S43_001769 [Phytophthora oleae]|uniref:Uncharacterized protein n=1 Tax=Phytophthora oleae TaxID=2107226 RepID=A0ABD3G1F2_9STRA
MTPNLKLLSLNDLARFNKNCQALKELNVVGERWAVLQSYQELEKILYLMRVLMHRRPEYQEASVGTINVLLALFPPSKRPSFVHTCRAASASLSMSANEGFAEELSDD